MRRHQWRRQRLLVFGTKQFGDVEVTRSQFHERVPLAERAKQSREQLAGRLTACDTKTHGGKIREDGDDTRSARSRAESHVSRQLEGNVVCNSAHKQSCTTERDDGLEEWMASRPRSTERVTESVRSLQL